MDDAAVLLDRVFFMMRPKSRRFSLPASLLLLMIFPVFLAAASQCVWTGVDKIVAVGDLHGAYDSFVEILKGTKVIDDSLLWIGGKTHLVQMGDIMDRGPDARKIFDLLIRLERQAERAGGMVHPLIGNHEMMNITRIALGYPGYVLPEQFVSFLPDGLRKRREENFAKRVAGIRPADLDRDLSRNEELKKYWQAVMKEDFEARDAYFGNFNLRYGDWIMNQNAVIKINDIVFVHGGISPEHSQIPLEEINSVVRKELRRLSRPEEMLGNDPDAPTPMIFDSAGPLWYRDLAWSGEPEFEAQVDKILANLKANFIVIAHSYRSGSLVIGEEFMARFQKRVWFIDTGISQVFGGYLSALIIDKGRFIPWGGNDEK